MGGACKTVGGHIAGATRVGVASEQRKRLTKEVEDKGTLNKGIRQQRNAEQRKRTTKEKQREGARLDTRQIIP